MSGGLYHVQRHTPPEVSPRVRQGDAGRRAGKPFNFSKSRGRLDWKLLHGVDLGRVVRERDLETLERGIQALLQGDVAIEDPQHMSPNNYMHLIRLCQLAVDFLEHEVAWLRNLAVALQEKHSALQGYFAALEQLRQCLKVETQALLECVEFEDRSEHLAAAKAVQTEKAQVAAANEQCEDAELSYQSFHFVTNRRPLDWRLLHSVDVNAIVSTGDITQLVAVEDSIAYGNLMEEDQETLTEANFRQLSKLAQCIVEVLCFYRLVFADEKMRWEEQCRVASESAMTAYSQCLEQERRLKEAGDFGSGKDSPVSSSCPPGTSESPVVERPARPQGSKFRSPGRRLFGTETGPAEITGSPGIVKRSPGNAEIQRGLGDLRLKMREECTHQEHMQSKLADLQRSIDRIKIRNLQLIIEEQQI